MKRPAPRRRSIIARDVRTPKYRPRIVRDRTAYTRKSKHKEVAR